MSEWRCCHWPQIQHCHIMMAGKVPERRKKTAMKKSRDEKLAYCDPAWQILCMLAFGILLPDFYIS